MNKLIVWLLLCAAEALLLGFGGRWFGPYVAPVLWLAAGLAIGWMALRYGPEMRPAAKPSKATWRDALVCTLTFALGAIVSTNLIKGNLRTTPIRADISDVIPQIQHLAGRWLRGEFPYQSIDFGYGYEFFPVYLPAHWFPFAAVQAAGMDERLGATLLLWGLLLIPLVGLIRATVPLLHKIAWIVLAFILLIICIVAEGFTFAISVEQLIMGYYILLMVAICRRQNPWLIGMAVLLCLLSRFSLLFWLPLLAFVLWSAGRSRDLLIAAGVAAAGVLLLYVVPFMLPQPELLWKAQQTYASATLAEWERDAGRPVHLWAGRGLAIYFFNMSTMGMAARLVCLQITGVAVSLLAAAGLGWYYHRHRTHVNTGFFLAGSLKIMLTIFYAFVQIPYFYLYLVPVGATIGLLYAIFVDLKIRGFVDSSI